MFTYLGRLVVKVQFWAATLTGSYMFQHQGQQMMMFFERPADMQVISEEVISFEYDENLTANDTTYIYEPIFP